MINWGFNARKNTSNSEYGRGVGFATGQQPTSNFAHGGHGQMYGGQQMQASPYFSVGQMQNGGMNFSPGHVHAPNCPNYNASGQSYGNTPTWSNYPSGQSGGDQAQAAQSYSGGGVYSTGGNSSTDFDVFVGDAVKNMDTNAASAANAGCGSGEGNQQASPQGETQQQQQQPQYNYNYYVPQKVNESEAGASNNFAQGMNFQPQQSGQAIPNQQFQSTGFGPPSAKVSSASFNGQVRPRHLARAFPQPQPLPGQASSSKSNYRLCGSCKKCRDLKETGSSPDLFAPSSIKPPRRPNVNYIPQPKLDRSLARARLPSASPVLASKSQANMLTRRASSIGAIPGRNTPVNF